MCFKPATEKNRWPCESVNSWPAFQAQQKSTYGGTSVKNSSGQTIILPCVSNISGKNGDHVQRMIFAVNVLKTPKRKLVNPSTRVLLFRRNRKASMGEQLSKYNADTIFTLRCVKNISEKHCDHVRRLFWAGAAFQALKKTANARWTPFFVSWRFLLPKFSEIHTNSRIFQPQDQSATTVSQIRGKELTKDL
jgi:hypothetical protein